MRSLTSHYSDLHDLPPTQLARPLPVRDAKTKGGKAKSADKESKLKQKKATVSVSAKDNDTPRAFARLMRQMHQPRRSSDGLDDGNTQPQKKDKKKKQQQVQSQPDAQSAAVPLKIQPGERLADFSARVDQSLPLSAIPKRRHASTTTITTPTGTTKQLRETRLTKHERRLRRLQEQWRTEEAALRAREADVRDERAEAAEQTDETWRAWAHEAGSREHKRRKKKRGKHGVHDGDGGGGFDDDDDDDPWAALNRKKAKAVQQQQLEQHQLPPQQAANPLATVQAPPTLVKPREVFKARGGAHVQVADVPVASGSLRRREELAGERATVVEQYRRLMASKRG